MSRFGWAYVNCEESGSHARADGVSGSVMFMTDRENMFISGNDFFRYKYDSTVPGMGSAPVSSLILTGTLYVSGAISASHFHYEDITRIDSSGSTRFGNTKDDLHIRTGSLHIGNGESATPTAFNVNLEASQSINVGGFRMNYRSCAPGNAFDGVVSYFSASMADHILGVKGSPDLNGYPVVIYLPSATSSSPPENSPFGGAGNAPSPGSAGGTYSPMAGAILTIKDEFTGSRATAASAAGSATVPGAIMVSASAGETIDGQAYYEMTGTMTAINIYSNGSNWFVF
jgi:hypothetical protein